jgi:hypothetical protein
MMEQPESSQVEALAARLQDAHGITFRRVPESVYPGMPYVSAADLVRTGATKYTAARISQLLHSGELAGLSLSPTCCLIAPSGVEQLFARERVSARDPRVVVKPGQRRRGR